MSYDGSTIHFINFVMNRIFLSLLCNGIILKVFLPSIVEAVIPSNEFDISFDPYDEDFNYKSAREYTRYAVALDNLGIEQQVRVEIMRDIDFGSIKDTNRSLGFSDTEDFELVLE